MDDISKFLVNLSIFLTLKRKQVVIHSLNNVHTLAIKIPPGKFSWKIGSAKAPNRIMENDKPMSDPLSENGSADIGRARRSIANFSTMRASLKPPLFLHDFLNRCA
jgi:hypothetical protein